MKRVFEFNWILFEVGNRTPRRNEFERGQKYFLLVEGVPTEYTFCTIREAMRWAQKNYFLFM